MSGVQGLLGTKLGMTQVWDEENRVVPVTAVKLGPCVVTQVRNPETDGYSAVQLGYGAIDPRKVNKPMAGHFAKAGVTPRRHEVEVRTEDASEVAVGQELDLSLFEEGALVDVTGRLLHDNTNGMNLVIGIETDVTPLICPVGRNAVTVTCHRIEAPPSLAPIAPPLCISGGDAALRDDAIGIRFTFI